MTDTYNSDRPYIGASLQSAIGTKDLWRNSEDKERLALYEENWNLFLGKHYALDGGPWNHPYGFKGVEENISYQMLNILGKATRAFSDLLYGDGIEIKSVSNPEFFSSIDTKSLWTAFVLSSCYGFCGIQPKKIEEKWCISPVKPEFLFLEFSPSDPNKIRKVFKRVPFTGVQCGDKKLSVLYEEEHSLNQVFTRIFEINGDSKVKELPFDFYKEYVDSSFNGTPYWNHGLGNFFITILFNEKIDNVILSDYTNAAKRCQQSLNDQKTQIARILKLHSNPKLIAPRNAFTQDTETGKWVWVNEDSEVIMGDPNDPNAYRYLTWDSNISAAVESRDDMIFSLCTELDLAPQLLSMPKLLGGTVAETSSKLKQLMHATIKKAERKREWAWLAIEKCVLNIAKLAGLDATVNDFSISFSEFIPRAREEKLDEMIARKSAGLISVKEALKTIDSLSDEEAIKAAQEIHVESSNEVPNVFREKNVPSSYFPPTQPDGE